MECSVLDKVKADLRKNNLVNKNLEAPASKEKEITRYVMNITKLARSKYNVDLGNMFNIRTKNSQVKLEPNIPAFEAIEKSRQYEIQGIEDKSKNQIDALDKNKTSEQIASTDEQDNTSKTVEPKGVPALEITC